MPVFRRNARAKRVMARASGAAIGYIAGNLPGAYAGYKMAGRAVPKPANSSKRTKQSWVTTQRDSTNVYQRKRMPRYKRKAWGKFVSKVKAATQDRGTVSFVMNGANAQLAPAAVAGVNKQLIQYVHLYGKNGTAVTTARDIGANDQRRIAQDMLSVVDDTAKIMFKSAVVDITCTNQIVPEQSNYEGPLEVDIYHIIYPTKKERPASGMNDIFTDALAQTETIGAFPKVEIEDRGATPFQMPQAISISGMKILSKKKRFLQYGQSFTLQIRDPRNRLKELVPMTDKVCFYDPGVTQTFMIVARPTAIIGTEQVFSLITGATRTYTVNYEGGTTDRSHYYNNFTV